jgi:predicted ATPase/transcriptional regulator with XRE-family HTH domain
MESPVFADLLRAHRVTAGLSQEALAERSGLSLHAVSRLERGGRRGPRRETVFALAHALRLSETQTTALESAAYRRRRLQPAPPPHPPGLPRITSPILGRETDLAVLPLMFRQPDARLLTLIGPAGVGKTRLALEVTVCIAPAFVDGITWVDLAPIHDPALVASTVALRLGLRADEAGQTERLVDHLRGRDALLILDNLEQVLPAVSLVRDLLDACPRLRILATSRVSLGLPRERRYSVVPLALPPPGQDNLLAVGEYPSVAMFLARARTVEPNLTLTSALAPVIAAVCRRLDGLPLAIELAAALTRLASPQAMLDRLGAAATGESATDHEAGTGRTLDLLASGSWDRPDRQQTMRQAIAWSYELLSPAEQAAFRGLGVFVGGWTIEAASKVAAVPLVKMQSMLEELSAKHLIRTAENGEGSDRFAMLETLREYAEECLAAEEHEAVDVRNRHLQWCVGLAEEAEPELTGPDQAIWLARLEDEHNNLRAALNWAREHRAGEQGLRLAGALWRFWNTRGYHSEGRRRLDLVLTMQSMTSVSAEARARALNGAANLADNQGDYERATALNEEALALQRAAGDRRGIAASLNGLGNSAQKQGRYEEAAALHEEALALRRVLGDLGGIAASLSNLGIAMDLKGDHGRAVALFEESLALKRAIGDTWGIAASLNNLGYALISHEEYQKARPLLEEALSLRRALGDKLGMATTLGNLGNIEESYDNDNRAVALYEEALALRRTLGDKLGTADSLRNLGKVRYRQGNIEGAATLCEEALLIGCEIGAQDVVLPILECLAWVAAAQGQTLRGARLGGAAEALRETLGQTAGSLTGENHEQAVRIMRAAIGEQTFAGAWAEGRGLTLEQIVAEFTRETAWREQSGAAGKGRGGATTARRGVPGGP